MQVPVDLNLCSDPQAGCFVKSEEVEVCFARAAGQIMSREGLNRYEAGDALVRGSTGDHWCVSRARFDQRYRAVAPLQHGQDGHYRSQPLPVHARQMPQRFSVRRSVGGDLIHGEAGDWLLQYAPGDYGIVADAKFRRLYRLA